jgi:hypothetical protein
MAAVERRLFCVVSNYSHYKSFNNWCQLRAFASNAISAIAAQAAPTVRFWHSKACFNLTSLALRQAPRVTKSLNMPSLPIQIPAEILFVEAGQ